jgi:hypothetical protein
MEKVYYYQYENSNNSNEISEFISEDKLNNNFNNELGQRNNSHGNHMIPKDGNNIEYNGSKISNDQKSILDISRPNQHQHLVEWESYKRNHNITDNSCPNYDNYTTEAAKFMNEIEIIFRNEDKIYKNQPGSDTGIHNGYNMSGNNECVYNNNNNNNKDDVIEISKNSNFQFNNNNNNNNSKQYEKNVINYDCLILEENSTLPPVSTVLQDTKNRSLSRDCENNEVYNENSYCNSNDRIGIHRVSKPDSKLDEFDILEKYCHDTNTFRTKDINHDNAGLGDK